MTGDMWIAVFILFAAIFLFVTEWLRVDVVALGVVVSLMLTGILTSSEAIAGFSSTAVLTIVSLFIVGGAVLHTGLAALIGQRILRVAGTDETRLIIVIMLAVALLSGFMSDTGTVAVLLPAIIALARSARISPSKLLIPLSFGALLGGAMTLIGTPPNIIVSDLLREENLRLGQDLYDPFQFFSYTPLGILLLLTGVGFMLVAGKKLLPDRMPIIDIDEFDSPHHLVHHYHLADQIHFLRIEHTSPLIAQSLAESRIRHNYGVTVIEILRQQERAVAQFAGQRLVLQSDTSDHVYPTPQSHFHVEDVIVIQGEIDSVEQLAEDYHLSILPEPLNGTEALVNRQVGVAEVLLPPRSRLIGKCLPEAQFAAAYNLNVLGITRPGEAKPLNLKDTPLEFGDMLLVQGFWQNIHALKKNRKDLVVMGEPENMVDAMNIGKAPIAAMVLIGMLILMVFEIVPLVTASMLAGLAMVLTGCLTMDEAYDAIDWKSIVLIAGMLPMATALEKVGLVSLIADWATTSLGNSGPIVILAGLFLLTSLFTQVLSNTATAVLVAPIALATAQELGIQPYAFLMGVAVAASMAFASPVASPVNTLVLGAGNYRFSDFIKVGAPLILLMMIVSIVVLPILFPF